MKKILLVLTTTAMLLSGCGKIEDSIDALGGRLDALEQSVSSIEEQIESINTQLTSLKATDEAIKEQISELEKSDKATATEIADLKKKDSALEKSINDLQNYVDTQIANAKSEAAAAYATVEQYNTIVAQLNALQSSTSKLGEELTAKINAEVKSLSDRIADLEARLKAVEDKVENLLARIQSVSYVPQYSDGKATLEYTDNESKVTLDFEISPKDAVAELAKVWDSAISVKAVYTQTRAVSFVDMPIVEFEADVTNGVISVTASGENLSEEFFTGAQEASVALTISDGNSSVTSEYVPMVAKLDSELGVIIPTNEIWYTSTDGNIVTPYATDAFSTNIVSNTYENGKGIITFDAPITLIGKEAFAECTSLTSVTIPDSIINIGKLAFLGCSSLTNITLPNSVSSIGECAFYACTSLTSVSIPNSVISFGNSIFAACESLESFCSQFASNDNRCLIIDSELNSFAPSGLTKYAIPYSVTSIGYYAFCGCSSLTSITIPDSVTSIGENAFYNCSSLTSVYCKPTTPPIGNESMFYDNAADRKIYVPIGSGDAYKAAEYWSEYADYIEEKEF